MANRLPKLLLLDTNAIIHRSFHALPPLTSPKGELVNAVYGFTATLLKAIHDVTPDYVIACFDASKDTFRNQLYPEYKAHRKETDQALYLQIPRVKQIIETLEIPLYAQVGLEADDLIGSVANKLKKDGMEIYIVTGDNDALQLVDERVKVYSLRRGVSDTLTYDDAAVRDKLGIWPKQVVDYKALAGDASDNIPGAPGVGPKTAVELLTEYESLDGVYAALDQLKPRLSQILSENRDQVFLSKQLAKIKDDVEIEIDLEAAKVENFNFDNVLALFNELDFKSLLTKLPKGTKESQSSLFAQVGDEAKIKPTLPYSIARTAKEVEQICEKLQKCEQIAVDTETVDVEGELIGISLAWSETDAVYIPIEPYEGALKLEEVTNILNSVLGNKNIKKIGHNIKFDRNKLVSAGLRLEGIYFDTMIASQLVNSQLFSHRLDDLALSTLGFKKIPTSQLLSSGRRRMTEVGLEELGSYACEDALVTFRLFKKLWPELEDRRLKEVFYQIEMPLIEVLSQMELRGIYVDGQYLNEFAQELQEKIKSLTAEIHKLSGREFNIASPLQLQQVLFGELKLPATGIKKTKNGYSTDIETLQKLEDAHPVIRAVMEYREMSKLLSTYVETLPKLLDGSGRVHTTFAQIGAATGRLSSNNPNLQNIPIRTELGTKVRRAFAASSGKTLLGGDYSQAELRVLAHLSEDPGLIAAFNQQADFHGAVAHQLGVDRRSAKAINFGIIYGLGAQALGRDLGISTDEAKQFIQKYFAKFPGVLHYIEKMRRTAREQGFVETVFGRRRYLPDIHSPNMMLRSAAERMAVNMPCQGTVADMAKKAMTLLNDELADDEWLILQIHDELLLEVPIERADEVGQRVKKVMESVIELKVPVIVDIKSGKNWAEL